MTGWDDREALQKAMDAFEATAGADNCVFNLGRCVQSACEAYRDAMTEQHAAEVEQARRDEREACAKVIGQMRGRSNGPGTDQRKRALQAAEAAIRARGGSDG